MYVAFQPFYTCSHLSPSTIVQYLLHWRRFPQAAGGYSWIIASAGFTVLHAAKVVFIMCKEMTNKQKFQLEKKS